MAAVYLFREPLGFETVRTLYKLGPSYKVRSFLCKLYSHPWSWWWISSPTCPLYFICPEPVQVCCWKWCSSVSTREKGSLFFNLQSINGSNVPVHILRLFLMGISPTWLHFLTTPKPLTDSCVSRPHPMRTRASSLTLHMPNCWRYVYDRLK